LPGELLYARVWYLLFFMLNALNSILLLLIPRFSSEDISGQNQVKASVQRRIRQSIADEVLLLQITYLDLYFLFISVAKSVVRLTQFDFIAVP